MPHPGASMAAVVAVLGLAVGWALSRAPVALAAAIPDSARMSEIRSAAARAPVLLVRGDFGLIEIRKAVVDSSGVRSPAWEAAAHARPAVFSPPDSARRTAAAPLAWSEISTIHTQHQRKLQGAVAGFVAGLAVGLTVYAATNPEENTGEDYSGVGWVFGTPVLGTITGFVIGSFTGTRLVYPQPSQENR